MPPGEKKRPVMVALIGAGAVILAAVIGVWGTRSHADSSTGPNKVEESAPSGAAPNSVTPVNHPSDLAPSGQTAPSKDDLIDYSGTVRDAKTNKVIGGAKVAITEDQDVPQRLTTDSEGVFYAKLHKSSNTILLTINATGYREYTRRAKSVRTGGEDIFLEPEMAESDAPVQPKPDNTADLINVRYERTLPPVGGPVIGCPCIEIHKVENGVTAKNNCSGPVPMMCVKDTKFTDPGWDKLRLAEGRLYGATTIPVGKTASFDKSDSVDLNCQFYACPGTDRQVLSLRCQVGFPQPPPVAACLYPQNVGVVGQPCSCPNGATGMLTQ